MPTTKRRALILISSGRQLPLVAPAEVKSISTGFFLVEMAQVLKEFENDYEFTFATPDGNAPQLDINGMALSVHSIEKTGAKTLPLRMQQRRRSFDVSSFRQRHPELAPAASRKSGCWSGTWAGSRSPNYCPTASRSSPSTAPN
jgi:hypothetical protein